MVKYPKPLVLKIKHFLLLWYIHITLAKAWLFGLALLHRSETWSWKVVLWSNLTPDSFLHLLLLISKLYILIISSSLVVTGKWYFFAILFIELSQNYLNKTFEASSKDCLFSSISSSFKYGVLSSAYDKRICERYLDIKGPSIESFGTLKIVFNHLQYDEVTFVLHFLLDR